MVEVQRRGPDRPRRIENSELRPVVDRLRSISDKDVIGGLNAKAEVDPKAGIVINHLTDDPVETDKGVYHFHSALIKTGAQNFVKPHVHEVGEEPYRVVQGSGEMNIGRIVNGEVRWDPPYLVHEGDEINVGEGDVHSLRNIGDEDTPLIFTFACPDSHLTDKTEENPQGDRVFTKDLDVKNPIPPHYPVAA